jgi:hypothetical protein
LQMTVPLDFMEAGGAQGEAMNFTP